MAMPAFSEGTKGTLQNMRIQAFLTAAAVNLKRLAAAFLVLLGPRAAIRLLVGLLAAVAEIGGPRPKARNANSAALPAA
jgi:hypothetical protein